MKKLKTILTLSVLLASRGHVLADNVEIKNLNYSGPIEITLPWFTDSVDVNNNGYDLNSFLELPVSSWTFQAIEGDTLMVLGGETDQIHLLSFPLKNDRFAEVELNIKGAKNYNISVDNKKNGNKLKLKPGTRNIGVKVLTKAGEKDTVRLSLSSPQSDYINTNQWQKGRAFTLDDVIYAEHFNSISVSPTGIYAILTSSKNSKGGKTSRTTKLINLKDGKTITNLSQRCHWMNSEDLLWFISEETNGKRNIKTLNPSSLMESVFAENIPEGDFTISPNNKFLVYFTQSEGPTEDKDIYRVINPEDRQPGYRTKYGLAIYDLSTGIYRPLTFGNKNVMLEDINEDGSKLLLMVMRNRFEKRPTSVFSLYELTLKDMKVDTLIFEDGFITGAKYNPTGKYIAISGSPESLKGIGKNVPEGRIPNMTEGELFIMDLQSRDVVCITKEFDPSVGGFDWNKTSGNLYFVAEDRDKKSLFSYNPKTGKITDMNVPEEIITNFSFANDAPVGAVIGESATNPDVLYAIDFKKGIPVYRRLNSTGEQLLSEVALADVINWDFINSKGDTINGRFYLPPNFDPTKKYPLIVNYYGGCSPTSRNFATRYPHHVYANNGYVVYVINPSGATGFGQEFASRHVNTAGEGVAQDIIEGTTKFIDEHPYIDKDKIGCIGASYGGFMTQYLQTVTDLFAAAISHAGISDHTSYWGNGYWGYSYSEVSMAESYPWTNPDLYVKQSPLYNAVKINTPILFLHGDEDTNVPPAESIQLFTALKLLGKDTALVEVEGQNHHILEPEKRQKWQDTIFAWFAKYLQDDPTWWNNMYPPTPLE